MSLRRPKAKVIRDDVTDSEQEDGKDLKTGKYQIIQSSILVVY